MNREKWGRVGHLKDPLIKIVLALFVDSNLSVKLNIST